MFTYKVSQRLELNQGIQFEVELEASIQPQINFNLVCSQECRVVLDLTKGISFYVKRSMLHVALLSFCMNPHSPNKFEFVATKYCFLILREDTSFFFLIISLFSFFLLFYVIINFYKNCFIIIIILCYFFFMKIIFIFPCSGMFRNVPACSGMFRVPGFIDGPLR